MHALLEAQLPSRLSHIPIAAGSRWFTWSPEFRDFAQRLRKDSTLRRRVQIIEVKQCRPYGATYSTDLERLPQSDYDLFQVFAKSLYDLRLDSRAIFLRNMLPSNFTANEVRSLFALLREALVRVAGVQSGALYSPVTPKRRDNGFNLHADLFLTSHLWVVFDDVPADGTGASLLLPFSRLVKAICTCEELPNAVATEILDLLSLPLRRDSYNRLYLLLHSKRHEWSAALRANLEALVYMVPFHRGEGYLINDRLWLHGREPVSTSISSRRFHRLIFGGLRAARRER